MGSRTYPLALRDEWYSDANYLDSGGRIVTMSPSTYLKRVRPLVLDDVSQDNIDDLKRMILAGRTLDPLKIYADGSEDGRHRAYAAKQLGIKQVPVVVWPLVTKGKILRYHATKRKPPAQLDREIASSLRTRGQPSLAALFADPEASRVFAETMRHELYKKQAAEAGAKLTKVRPYTVKRGTPTGRELYGRYPTEEAARAAADKVGGWVEQEGRVIYGVTPPFNPPVD